MSKKQKLIDRLKSRARNKYLLKHKGYYGEVYFSEEDEAFVGKLIGFRGMIAVHEDTASKTIKEMTFMH